ncbi:MAG TPA: hypothetical protein VK139_03005 [Microbacteriaceae bacterium]|nr:hypothetical protein [Microbacteriaceae bacterium]
MKKKIIAGVALGAAAVLGFAGPAMAASDLITINENGGTGADDGLKIQVAFGQIQVTGNGAVQLYSTDAVPDPSAYGNLSNYPIVVFNDPDEGVTVVGYSGLDDTDTFTDATDAHAWESFTSESTIDGNSGTVTNHLVYSDGNSDEVNLDYKVSYTYPNQYLNLELTVTSVGADFTGVPYKMYWITDATLGGEDAGMQFGGTAASGAQLGGVVSPDGSTIQSFRQTSGQSLNWFAGYYGCPMWENTDNECVPDGTANPNGLWIQNYQDFPNAASTVGTVDEPLDNGWGASSPELTAVNTAINFDMIFASCLDGVEALQCAFDAAGESAPAAAAPVLATTGSDASAIVPAVAVMMLLGAAATAFAVRRRNA